MFNHGCPKRCVLALTGLLSTLVASSASAQHYPVQAGDVDCSTPRRALLTWLSNLQPDDTHPELASECFDWEAVQIESARRRQDSSQRLKDILDSRGLYVDMEEVPDEEDPEDVDQVRPFPNGLAGFYLVRKGSSWVISAETIRQIPTWYDETFAFDIDSYLEGKPAWLSAKVMGVATWQLILLVFVVLAAFLIRWIVTKLVQTQGTRLLTRFITKLDADLLRRAASPIGTVVMILLLMYVFPALRFGVDVSRVVAFALRVAAAVSGVLILYRMVDVGADVMSKRADETDTKLDDQLVPLVRKSLKVVTVVLGLIFVLQNMEVDVGSLIAGVSLGGLAFTLAAQDTVANLFGSVSIFSDQPFQVGDWVKIDSVEGIVEEVGMRSTRVRTFYRSLVSIPNSRVANGVVDNYGRRDCRRTFTTLGLEYRTSPEQMEAFCDRVRAILAASPKVKKDSYQVQFTNFGASALEIVLVFYLLVESWDDELLQRHRIYLEILRLADQVGVGFAFPTQTIHIASQAAPGEMPDADPLATDVLGQRVTAFGPGGELARPGGVPISHGFYAGYDAETES